MVDNIITRKVELAYIEMRVSQSGRPCLLWPSSRWIFVTNEFVMNGLCLSVARSTIQGANVCLCMCTNIQTTSIDSFAQGVIKTKQKRGFIWLQINSYHLPHVTAGQLIEFKPGSLVRSYQYVWPRSWILIYNLGEHKESKISLYSLEWCSWHNHFLYFSS